MTHCSDTDGENMMAMRPHCSDGRSLLLGVNNDWMTSFLSYLSIKSICRLDIAVSDTTSRATWLSILCLTNHYTIDEYSHSNKSIRWLVKRGMRLKKLTVIGGDCCGDIVDGSTLLGLNLSSLQYLSFLFCRIGDVEVSSVAHGCPYLLEISLSKCYEVTDKCMIELVENCHELTSIIVDSSIDRAARGLPAFGDTCLNQITESLPDRLHISSLSKMLLVRCNDITDIVVSAILHKSPLLNNVIFSRCRNISDMSVSALAHNCPLLKKISICECEKITETSVLALSRNCPLLEYLNLTYSRITDNCILALSQNCPLLNEVILYGCDEITDLGVSALAHNCPLLYYITLAECDKITDLSVSALARNCPLLSVWNCWNLSMVSANCKSLACIPACCKAEWTYSGVLQRDIIFSASVRELMSKLLRTACTARRYSPWIACSWALASDTRIGLTQEG